MKSARRIFLAALAALVPLLGPGCKRADDPASGGPGAVAATSSGGGFGFGAEESGPAPAVSDGVWNFDPAHTFALFKVRHFAAGYTYGGFRELAGRVVLDSTEPSKNLLELTIQTASIDSFNAKRDDHLRSPDFLNALQFPTLSFRSTSLAREADGTWTAHGDLTLKGVTKQVTLRGRPLAEVDDPMGRRRAAFEASFVIPRLEYGVSFMADTLGSDVAVLVAAEAVKE